MNRFQEFKKYFEAKHENSRCLQFFFNDKTYERLNVELDTTTSIIRLEDEYISVYLSWLNDENLFIDFANKPPIDQALLQAVYSRNNEVAIIKATSVSTGRLSRVIELVEMVGKTFWEIELT